MPLWIPVTIAAALFQTARFMLQKSLSATRLSASGATFARFVYSAPVVLMGLGLWLLWPGHDLPTTTGRFWGFAAVGGTTQILATVCVVLLFKQRNFAVGITFKKTEVIQTVLVGLVVLGEGVSAPALAAIMIGLVGVMVLSKPPGGSGAWWRHQTNRASLLGLGSGVLFAVSAVCYRGAALELTDAGPVLRAAVTLAAVVSLQTLALGGWLAWRDRVELAAVWAARRTAVFVGLFSLGGSFCWFLAFALQNAAYVKALGQVELVASLLVSVLVFRERITGREVAGMALLAISIVGLVLTI
jgi:drug/metabolite transporter (DMT)-like permease